MTTPAISESNVPIIQQTGQRWSYPCNGGAPGLVTSANCVNLRRSHTRPASINNPKNRANWRNPSAWSHSKFIDNPRPDGTTVMWVHLPGTPGCTNIQRFEYTHGLDWTLTGSSLPAFPSFLEGRAVSRALLKLKHQSVNLAVAFAERKQTMDMFSSNAKTIARQVRNFKGSHPKDWKQVVKGNWKNTPNRWLELQYGWKPLISDIQGACQAFDTLESSNNPYLAKVSGVSGENTESTWNKVSNTTTINYFKVQEQWKHRCRVVLYYKLRNPLLARFASLGLTNPFELAWEKMKYSFVIDWFLPVGNWLSALDADFGWDFHSGTLTKFTSGGADSVYLQSGDRKSVV